MGAEGGDRGSGVLEDARRGAFAAGATGFLDDLATVFASWLAAAPRAWAALALAVVAVTAWTDREWLPDVSVVAGCVVARALPWRVPTVAALVAVLLAVLTFASDTLAPDVRDVLVIAAPATAAAVVSAWAVARESPRSAAIPLAVLAVALGAALVARGLGDDRSPAWDAAVPAGAVAAVIAAGSSMRWGACALLTGMLAAAHGGSWPFAPFGLLEAAGSASLVTGAAVAARRALHLPPVDGDSASARCATAIRRRPLAAALVGVGLVCLTDPLAKWLVDVSCSAQESIFLSTRVGDFPPALPWPAGWLMVPVLAAHVVALDGFSSAVRRASVTAVVLAGTSSLFALSGEIDSGFASGGIGRAWLRDQALDAAVSGIVMIVLAIYACGTIGRRPGSAVGGADFAAISLAAAAQVLRLWIEPAATLQQFAPEILLGIALHRTAMTRFRVRTLLAGVGAVTFVITAFAAPRSTRLDWLVAVTVVTGASFGRVLLCVLILRRIRSLTPVPDDHPIVADYAADLRVRAAGARA